MAIVDGMAMNDGQENMGDSSTESNSLHFPFWAGCSVIF
jgi:hypothetical protein